MDTILDFIEGRSNFVRWLLLIPGAVIATYVSYLVVGFCFNLGLSYMHIERNSVLHLISEGIYGGGVIALVFLQAVYTIAPHHKSTIVIVTAFVTSIIEGIAFVNSRYPVFSEVGLATIFYIGQAIYTCVQITKDPQCLELRGTENS